MPNQRDHSHNLIEAGEVVQRLGESWKTFIYRPVQVG